MQRADLTTRAVAGLVDLLLIIGLARLPDVIGFLSAAGYILIRDGLFDRRSIGKKLIGLRVLSLEDSGPSATYRDSIIRNVPIVLAYFLFLIPYAGWILCPLALGMEGLIALGDRGGMRIGDMLARTQVVPEALVQGEKKPAPEQRPEASPTGTNGPLDTQQ
ncbi:MAG: RDD family protein [Nitrospirae bacterium]|nr:RDD family protein [Nitrospirota bacterium]